MIRKRKIGSSTWIASPIGFSQTHFHAVIPRPAVSAVGFSRQLVHVTKRSLGAVRGVGGPFSAVGALFTGAPGGVQAVGLRSVSPEDAVVAWAAEAGGLGDVFSLAVKAWGRCKQRISNFNEKHVPVNCGNEFCTAYRFSLYIETRVKETNHQCCEYSRNFSAGESKLIISS